MCSKQETSCFQRTEFFLSIIQYLEHSIPLFHNVSSGLQRPTLVPGGIKVNSFMDLTETHISCVEHTSERFTQHH
jgi:hypothetical protein